jgi:uncharacterized protein YkwD
VQSFKSTLRAIVWLPIALVLLGCEPALDFLPQLLGQDVPDKPQTPRAPVQSPAIARDEAEVRQRINEIRQERGLNQLRDNFMLAQVARNYSQKMARKNFFSHTSPDGDTPAQRVRSAGIFYLVMGENLFKSTNVPKPVPLAVEGWMDSPGHRENIMHPEYTQTGVGIWREGNTYYITQLFMRSEFSPRDLFK